MAETTPCKPCGGSGNHTGSEGCSRTTWIAATDIRPGDWVTLARRYAVLHARERYGRDAVVLKKTVAANEVAWAGTDWNEWFYTPLELRATGDYRTTHEAVVANAVARGLKVPREVLSEYPHLRRGRRAR